MLWVKLPRSPLNFCSSRQQEGEAGVDLKAKRDGFCSIDSEGSPSFGKVGTVGKSWYMYQLTMSKLRWTEHSFESDKVNWYMYQLFPNFGMYQLFQKFSGRKWFFYLHKMLKFITKKAFSLHRDILARYSVSIVFNLWVSLQQNHFWIITDAMKPVQVTFFITTKILNFIKNTSH